MFIIGQSNNENEQIEPSDQFIELKHAISPCAHATVLVALGELKLYNGLYGKKLKNWKFLKNCVKIGKIKKLIFF